MARSCRGASFKRNKHGDFSVHLRTASTAACELWLRYVHAEKLPVWQEKSCLKQQNAAIEEAFDMMIELYGFSSMIGDEEAMDASISGIQELSAKPHDGSSGAVPGCDNVSNAYRTLVAKLPLRPLMVDLVLCEMDAEWVGRDDPEEFVLDLEKLSSQSWQKGPLTRR